MPDSLREVIRAKVGEILPGLPEELRCDPNAIRTKLNEVYPKEVLERMAGQARYRPYDRCSYNGSKN
jgi:hypothetical protein